MKPGTYTLILSREGAFYMATVQHGAIQETYTGRIWDFAVANALQRVFKRIKQAELEL